MSRVTTGPIASPGQSRVHLPPQPDTGRTVSTVSDERGEYRLRGLPAGRYKVQAELSGFSTIVIPEIELLVGQNRSLPFQMQVASLSETLTVTGESPLVDISSTQVAGNVDRRQMEELPLQGRNWMELAMQVKGITANAVDTTPGVRDRQFQLNLDGQEITQQVAGSGFGQLPGTLHFRTTFLPPRDEMEELVEKMKVFHGKYVESIRN